jgi:hypothetical protein
MCIKNYPIHIIKIGGISANGFEVQRETNIAAAFK